MLAEEYSSTNESATNFELPVTKVLDCIIDSILQTTPKFIAHIKTAKFAKKALNEDDLSQELVVLINRELNILQYPFLVSKEYRDLYNATTGRADFYFCSIEDGQSTQSIFSCEAKRLPAPPPREREKEYVIGQTENGGIERFKIEKHGKGLQDCSLIGFIEKEEFSNWLRTVNLWIIEQATQTTTWNVKECLSQSAKTTEYLYSKSIAIRQSDPDLNLHHIWIGLV
jgi:hypothetical protein